MLTIKISYSLFFRYVKISRPTITYEKNLPHLTIFSVLPFLPFFPAIGMPKSTFTLDPKRTPNSNRFKVSNRFEKPSRVHGSFTTAKLQKQTFVGVLKICCKFTGEQLCRSVISTKLQRTYRKTRTQDP